MPKAMEQALIKQAKKKGWWGKKKKGLTKRGRAYVYGTMRKSGWKPKGEK
jgi:hypothetical protein